MPPMNDMVSGWSQESLLSGLLVDLSNSYSPKSFEATVLLLWKLTAIVALETPVAKISLLNFD